MRLTISLTSIVVGLIACAGDIPTEPNNNNDQDAGVDTTPDTPAQELGKTVSGKTVEYFTPTSILDDVAVASDGIDPPLTSTSAGGGLWSFPAIPTGSKFYFTATKANYRPTRNAAVSVTDADVTSDLYIVSIAEATRQYTTTGNTAVAGTAVVFAEIQRNNGLPFDGLTIATAFSLVDALDAPIAGVKVYGFGTTDVDPAQTVTTVAGGKVRIALLDVPPGIATLKVSFLNNQGVAQTITAPVITAADGATLLLAGGADGGGGGGGNAVNPPNLINPTFAADIYPVLQRVSAGGLGCASCHTLGGDAGAVLQYDLPAADVLAALTGVVGRVVLTAGSEGTSTFLTMPLYEPAPVNHPNATFLDINDPYYKMFLAWIVQGTLP